MPQQQPQQQRSDAGTSVIRAWKKKKSNQIKHVNKSNKNNNNNKGNNNDSGDIKATGALYNQQTETTPLRNGAEADDAEAPGHGRNAREMSGELAERLRVRVAPCVTPICHVDRWW